MLCDLPKHKKRCCGGAAYTFLSYVLYMVQLTLLKQPKMSLYIWTSSSPKNVVYDDRQKIEDSKWVSEEQRQLEKRRKVQQNQCTFT